MKQSAIENIKTLCEACIEEGENLFDNAKSYTIERNRKFVSIDGKLHSRWIGNCCVLFNLLGPYSEPWDELFKQNKDNSTTSINKLIGALTSINQTIVNGFLIDMQDLFSAEIFMDLLEQAEHLHERNYHIAACILCRAVIEERLKELVNKQSAPIKKKKPMLADYNTALYKNNFYDKAMMKHIEALAAIGNKATHEIQATPEDTKRMLNETTALLTKLK